MQVPQRKGDPLLVDVDEGVRPGTTAESLGALKPAFDKNGTITAGNASQISDGGAAVIVMSAAKAKELGLAPLGQIVSYGQVAGPDTSLLDPALAGHRSRRRRRPASTSARIDLFEINEAFAAVGLASADDLGIDEGKINVNGGAIALGHPVGMSGTRVALTALLELRRRGASLAAVALCGGGGQGDAAILRGRSAEARSARLAGSDSASNGRDEAGRRSVAHCASDSAQGRPRGGRCPGRRSGTPRRTTRSRPSSSSRREQPQRQGMRRSGCGRPP